MEERVFCTETGSSAKKLRIYSPTYPADNWATKANFFVSHKKQNGLYFRPKINSSPLMNFRLSTLDGSLWIPANIYPEGSPVQVYRNSGASPLSHLWCAAAGAADNYSQLIRINSRVPLFKFRARIIAFITF